MVKEKVKKFFEHPLTVTLFGTGFVSIIVVWLTFYCQNQLLVTGYKLEKFRAEIADTYQIADELNRAMSERLFNLNRVIWGFNDAGPEEFPKIWEEYYASVRRWNIDLAYYKFRLQRVAAGRIIQLLVNEKDYLDIRSIHGAFIDAHARAQDLKRCYSGCAEDAKQNYLAKAKNSASNLAVKIENLVNEYSKQVARKNDTAEALR